MMNPYWSYTYYYMGNSLTFIIIALLVAVILAVVLFFTFMSKKNEGKFTGAKGKLYNFLCFNKFYVEDILKLLYVVSAVVVTVLGVVMLFESFLVGLLLLIVGNVLLRVSYELIMMFIILCRKTVSIDRKLGADAAAKPADEPAAKPADEPKAEPTAEAGEPTAPAAEPKTEPAAGPEEENQINPSQR